MNSGGTGTAAGAAAMIAGMAPRLDPRPYRFVAVSPGVAPQLLGAALATFREDEGVSAIVPAEVAEEAGLSGPDFACITLMVASDLEAVGLTAAVAGALAAGGIACNMVAALHHDHAFVPAGDSARALAILKALQANSRC